MSPYNLREEKMLVRTTVNYSELYAENRIRSNAQPTFGQDSLGVIGLFGIP